MGKDAKLNFEQAANLWLETNRHALSSNTVKRRKIYIKGLTPYFRNLPTRNITRQNCGRWFAECGATLVSEIFVRDFLLRRQSHFGDVELAEGVHDIDHDLIIHVVRAFDDDTEVGIRGLQCRQFVF